MEDEVTISPFDSSTPELENVTQINNATMAAAAAANIQCGQMTKSELNLWLNVQYYTEGVCFSIVGCVGFVGNLISIGILHTK